MKQNYKIVSVDVFNRGVLVFIGSQQQLLDCLTREYPSYKEEVEQGFEEEERRGDAWTIKLADDALIWADHFVEEKTIVHEIVHTAKHLLNLVDVDNEEVLCYTVEYLYGKIMPWYRSIIEKSQT